MNSDRDNELKQHLGSGKQILHLQQRQLLPHLNTNKSFISITSTLVFKNIQKQQNVYFHFQLFNTKAQKEKTMFYNVTSVICFASNLNHHKACFSQNPNQSFLGSKLPLVFRSNCVQSEAKDIKSVTDNRKNTKATNIIVLESYSNQLMIVEIAIITRRHNSDFLLLESV